MAAVSLTESPQALLGAAIISQAKADLEAYASVDLDAFNSPLEYVRFKACQALRDAFRSYCWVSDESHTSNAGLSLEECCSITGLPLEIVRDNFMKIISTWDGERRSKMVANMRGAA